MQRRRDQVDGRTRGLQLGGELRDDVDARRRRTASEYRDSEHRSGNDRQVETRIAEHGQDSFEGAGTAGGGGASSSGN